jgi:hypothetical protein
MHQEVIPEGAAANTVRCKQVLVRVREAKRPKRPGMWSICCTEPELTEALYIVYFV